MSENISVKRAPEGLRKLEIGQAFDGRLNTFKPDYCLDLQKLYDGQLLKFNNDEVIEYYAFRDFSTEITDHSVIDIGGGIKGGGPTASLSAAYNYYQEKSSMLKENKLSAEIYKVKKVSIEIVNMQSISGELDKYMKEGSVSRKLRDDYDAIRKADGPNRKLLVEKFKMRWGTGIVTRLELIGGAIAEIEFSSSSSDAKSNTIHEGEMSFESKFVSAKGKLQLSEDIRKFSLSVKQTGSVVSFPSEVASYKNFIKEQVDYIKKYIAGKTTEATAPDFIDDRKPITAKDLNLKEKAKDDPATKAREALEKDMGDLEKEVVLKTNESLLTCTAMIYKYEKDPVELIKIPVLFGRLDTSKKGFKTKFNETITKVKATENADGLPADEYAFIKKLEPELSKIRQFKIPGAKPEDVRILLFNGADIDPVIAYIAAAKARP
jgi:hypothetical protein